MLLTDARQVMVGTTPAQAVYVGSVKVWPPVPTFDPASLSGLAVWLDASQLTGAVGDPVSPWPNLAAGGPSGTIVGTPAPKVSTNTLNGKKLIRFTVSEGRLRMTGTGVFLDYTLVYLARMAPGGSFTAGRIVTTVYPPNNFLLGYWNGFEDVCYSVSGAFFLPDNRPAATTNWNLYSSDGTAANWHARLFKNGVLLSTSPTGGAIPTQDGWGGNFNLSGYDATTTAETCDFEIAELVLYNRQLTDTERQQVESYLKTKYGVS